MYDCVNCNNKGICKYMMTVENLRNDIAILLKDYEFFGRIEIFCDFFDDKKVMRDVKIGD